MTDSAADLSVTDQRQLADDPEAMAETRWRLSARDASSAPIMTREQFDAEFPA